MQDGEFQSERLSRALREAMRWLAPRARSAAETRERLLAKGHDEATADAAVARLREMRVLDDEALAQDVARGVVRRAPAARDMVRERVEQRGVEGEAAESAARRAAGGLSDRDAAFLAARRYVEALPRPIDAVPAARRLAGFLARRGFDAYLCEEATLGALAEAGARFPPGVEPSVGDAGYDGPDAPPQD